MGLIDKLEDIHFAWEDDTEFWDDITRLIANRYGYDNLKMVQIAFSKDKGLRVNLMTLDPVNADSKKMRRNKFYWTPAVFKVDRSG